MIRITTRLVAVVVCAVLMLGAFTTWADAAAGVPRIMNYQGRLMNASGSLLGGSGTDYCVKFSLYDNATVGSGSKLWPASAPSTMTVNVKNGVFNAGIGDTNANGDTLDFNFEDTDAVYLNVEVAAKVGATCAPGDGAESFETLSPRQRVTAAGYAINSATLNGKAGSYYLANSFSTTSAAFSLSTYDKGYFFSTTSVVFWDAQQSRWATTSSDAWFATKTTDQLTQGSSNLYYSNSLVNSFVGSSSTVPKTFTNNTYAGTNTFAGNVLLANASTTNFDIAGTISGAGLVSCSASSDKLVWNATTRQFGCGADAGAGGGITALGAQYSVFQTGASQTLATSSDTNLGITIMSSGDTHTFTPTWFGTLAAGRGGTGIGTVSQNGILIGGAGNTWAQIATSSLGLPTYGDLGAYLGLAAWYATTTDALAEGPTNKYFTTNRVAAVIAATTTDAIAEGSTNKYYTDSRVQTYLNGLDKGFYFSTTSAASFAAAGLAFSTTSADYYASQNPTAGFSTTSTDYWKTQNNFHSTSSFAYDLSTYDKGFFFSTTSVAYWDAQQFRWATTSTDAWFATKSTSDLPEGTNLYYTASRVAGVIAGTTTDALTEGSTNKYYTDTRVNNYVGASSTVAKTFANNTFLGTNSFQNTTATNATSTTSYAGTASSSNLYSNLATIGSLIAGAFTGNVVTATNATTTTLYAGTASSTNSYSNAATVGTANVGSLSLGSALTGSNGGTGLSSVVQNSLLIGGAGNTWAQVSTSSLGLPTFGDLGAYLGLAAWYATTTDALAEGSTNKYFTTNRVAAVIAGTTTDAIAEGSANKYYQDSRVQTFLNTISKGFFFSTTSASNFASAGLAFSTTSTDYWKTQNNFHSTSSFAYDLSTYDKGFFFSTTSVAYWDAQQFRWATTSTDAWFATKSTSDLPEGTNLYYTASRVAGVIAGTTTDALTEGSTNKYYQDARVQSYLNSVSKGFFFATTSSDYWKTQNNFFSTTSASSFASVGLAFSTTSAAYFNSQNQGASFSTTSTDYWKTQNNFFSTTSASFFSSAGLSFSTTSTDFWQSQRNFFSTTSASHFSSLGLAFSTTSSAYFLSQNQGAAFSTTSATAFVHASTTIPKTYSNNTYTGTNSFQDVTATNATSTTLSTTVASTSNQFISGVSNGLLSTAANGAVQSTGFAGPLSFSGGLLSLAQASSTANGYLSSIDWNAFNSRLSSSTLALFDKGFFFSTTSADVYIAATSSIPKTYTTNTFIGINNFANITATGATTTTLFSGTASSTNVFATAARFGSLSGFSLSGAVAAAGNSITGLGIASTTDLWISNIRNGLLATNGQGNIVASSTPTASSFNATSQTAASQLPFASTTQLTALQLISIGAANGTILQGSSTGTSTLAGVISVTGTNSTSTFSGGVQATRLNLTTGTSTSAGGFNLSAGCYAINGVCISGAVNSVTATNTTLTVNPNSGNVGISLNLANPNVWTGLQQFGNASTSLLEATQFYARTIQSTSSNALVLQSNLSSTAGLTFGSTSTPQVAAIDTINNRFTLGTGGANPSLLVLDTKNTAGDPSGVAGSMYYNSNIGAFRCFNTSWVTCGGQAASSTGDVQFRNIDGSFTATSNFNWSMASNGLDLQGTTTQTTDLLTISSSTGRTMFAVDGAGVMTLASTTDPAAPASGQVNVYAKEIAGRMLPKWIGPAGVDTPFQANLGFNKVVMVSSAGAALSAFGATLANVGTLSAGALAVNTLKQSVRRTTITSATTAGSLSSSRSTTALVTRGNAAGIGGFFYTIRFGLTTLQAGNRGFVGLSDVTTAPTNVDPTTNTTPGKVGIAFNANTGNWKFVQNVTGTAPTVLDLGASFPINTTDLYELIMYAKPNDTVINYRITNLTSGAQISSSTTATNIPANTTYLTAVEWMTNNATAAAVAFDLSAVYLESDN